MFKKAKVARAPPNIANLVVNPYGLAAAPLSIVLARR
jgi:hypothetical protein